MYENKKNFPGAVGLLVKAGSKGAGGTAESLKKAAEFERQILGAATKGAKGLYSAGFWIVTATVSISACPPCIPPYLKGSQLFQLTESPTDWEWLDMLSYASGGVLMILMLLGIIYDDSR